MGKRPMMAKPEFSWDVYDEGFWKENGSPNHREAGRWIGKAIYDFTDRPARVLDVGCGTGQMLRGAKLAGAKLCSGLESQQGLDHIRRLGISDADPDIPVQPCDLREFWEIPHRGFDTILCVEVLEHLPERCAIDAVWKMCLSEPKWLALSGALPGQTGTGHINEHPGKYWVDLVHTYGTHRLDLDRTLLFQRRLREKPGYMFWWSNNINLYRRVR
jgi:SAM-dependent methyltransferase